MGLPKASPNFAVALAYRNLQKEEACTTVSSKLVCMGFHVGLIRVVVAIRPSQVMDEKWQAHTDFDS